MKRLFCLIMLLPFAVHAQEKGIQFEHGLSWQQVKAKAKGENKYIFIDCYATWCGPCKVMDRDIYPQGKVGDFYNKSFISVKVQMDKTDKDNEAVKSWYADAEQMMNQYKVEAFPTFLFLSSDGKLLHRAVGGYDAEGFISVANDALNPEKQYYTMIADYQQGERDTSVMKQLARSAESFGDKEMSEKIAKDYISRLDEEELCTKDNILFIRDVAGDKVLTQKMAKDYINSLNKNELHDKENIMFIRDVVEDKGLAQRLFNNYINGLKEEEIFTTDNIELLSSFAQSSNDKSFQILYKNKDKVDKVMGRENYSQGLFDYVIAKEEIDPIIMDRRESGADPNWNEIMDTIKKKYNTIYADRAILLATARWYGFKKDWLKFSKSKVVFVKKYGAGMSNWEINNDLGWPIFLYSNNKDDLTFALSHMEKVVKEEPDFLSAVDTYANLLYKVGRKNEAIKWQEEAIKRDPGEKGFQVTLEKMKRGEPTWPTSNN